MASATMDHVLPEVRPVVTNMPERTYEVQTDGSARFRDLPIDDNNHYRVRGIPGYTHNASAIAAISADFSIKRSTTTLSHIDWYGQDDFEEEKLQVNAYGDAERMEKDRNSRYDRAIEKGVGSIRIVPENCHQDINEPTRAISEIRTIVTAQDQLDSMTYTEERGYFADDRTGIRVADADVHGTVNVDVLGYTGFVHGVTRQQAGVAILRYGADDIQIAHCYILTGPGTVIEDTGKSVSRSWDGTLRFRFVDEGKNLQYYQADPITVRMPCSFIQFDTTTPRANDPAHDAVVAGGTVIVRFGTAAEPIRTPAESTGKTNSYWLGEGTGTLLELLGNATQCRAGGHGLPVVIDTQHSFGVPAQPDAASHKFFAAPVIRIPAGRQYGFSGPRRVETPRGSAVAADPTGFIGYNDTRHQLSELCRLVDPTRRLIGGKANPAQRLLNHIIDTGATIFHANGNLLMNPGGAAVELYAGYATIGGQNIAGGFHFKDLQRHTSNTTHSLLKHDAQHDELVSKLNLVTQAQKVRMAGAGATHLIQANDVVVTSELNVARQYRQDTVVERADGNMYGFDNDIAQRNMTLLTTGNDTSVYTGNTTMTVNLAGGAIDTELAIIQKTFAGGMLALLPLQLRFIHDHLVVKPHLTDVTQGNGNAPYNLPFIPTAGEIAAAAGNAVNVAELQLLAAAGALLRAEFVARGGDVDLIVDGIRMAFSTIANVAVAGPITAQIAAGLAADPPTHKVDALWNDAFLTSQSIQEAANVGVRLSHVQPFYALGDVTGADLVARSATSRFDTNSFATATTVCNAAYQTALQVPLGTDTVDLASPMNIIEKLSRLPVVANQEHYGVAVAGADAGNVAARLALYRAVKNGYGDQFEVVLADLSYPAGTELRLKGYALTTAPRSADHYRRPRYAYIMFPDIGADLAAAKRFTIVRANLETATLRVAQEGALAGDPFHVITCFHDAVILNAAGNIEALTAVTFAAAHAGNRPPGLQSGGNFLTHCLVQIESGTLVDNNLYDLDAYINLGRGLAYRGRRRVSQPLCAPILNPDVRIGCYPPLNFGTRHLPPEMRDFRLELNDVDFSFLEPPLSGSWSFDPLKMYNFSGGNQVATAHDSLLYLPQFQHFEFTAEPKFTHTIYSSNGMPSYIAIYCRHTDLAEANNYSKAQPLIETLNIRCDTTKRKSDVVCDNMDKSYLYHMTMRNAHPRSAYDSYAYNNRQVVLLAAEDIGIMGLHAKDYQRVRRVRFEVSGTVNGPGQLQIVLIYNNRALEIYGADIKVVRL